MSPDATADEDAETLYTDAECNLRHPSQRPRLLDGLRSGALGGEALL